MKMKKRLHPVWEVLIKHRSITPREPVDPSLAEEKGVSLLVAGHLFNWIFICIPAIITVLGMVLRWLCGIYK